MIPIKKEWGMNGENYRGMKSRNNLTTTIALKGNEVKTIENYH